jgi:hypothetical protein
MTDDRTLEAILADPRFRRRRTHSPLYEWMKEHHDAVAEEFAKYGPQWALRIAAMQEGGLLDGTGKPPTVRTAQRTWYRVRADLEDGKQAKQARASDAAKLPARKPVTTLPTEYTAKPLGGALSSVPRETSGEDEWQTLGGRKV